MLNSFSDQSHKVFHGDLIWKLKLSNLFTRCSIYLFKNILGNSTTYLILALITFLVLIYLNSFRESIEDFVRSEENIEDVKTYTH